MKKTKPSFHCELFAARALERRGWQVLHQDVQVAHVQVDILARDPRGVLTVVEVKTRSRMAQISWRQRARLMRAGNVLAGSEPVQMVLVLVSNQDIEVLPVDALTV